MRTFIAWNVIACFLLVATGGIAAAAGGDDALDRAREARDGLFGPGGSLAWLVAGNPDEAGQELNLLEAPWLASAGPVGEDDYVGAEGDAWWAVDLDADGTFTSEGYLRAVPSGATYAAGISGGGEQVAVVHSGAMYVGLATESPGYGPAGDDITAIGIDVSAGDLVVSNEGQIFVDAMSANGGNAIAAGLYTLESDQVSVVNGGGLYTTLAMSNLLDNGGYAAGILALDAGSVDIVNRSGATVLAELASGSSSAADGAYLWGAGMAAEIVGTATMRNDGLVAAVATGDGLPAGVSLEVAGAWFLEGDDFSFTNGSTGEVVAAVEGVGDWSDATVYGVSFDGGATATFTNHGRIGVIGPGTGDVDGTLLLGASFYDCGSVTVVNDGTITVTGAGDGAALFFQTIDEARVTSPGMIATAEGVYGLAAIDAEVTLGDADGNAGAFAWTFRGDPDTAATPFYVGAGASLDLNGATLVAAVGAGMSWDTPYPLYTIEDDGSVTGSFGALVSPNPDFAAAWADLGGGSGPEAAGGGEEGQAVSFRYEPRIGEGVIGVHAALTTFRHLLDVTVSGEVAAGAQERQLARAAGPVRVAALGSVGGRRLSWAARRTHERATEIYVLPIEGGSLDASDLGYDADLSGFRVGLRHRVGDRWSFGLFAGTGDTDVDLDRGGSDDQDYDLYGAWVRVDRGSLFGFAAVALASVDHDYAGRTGPTLEMAEQGTWSSDGLALRVGAGWVRDLGNWSLVPGAELSWTSWTTDRHRTRAADPDWDLLVDEYDEDFVDVALGADLLRTWAGRKDTVTFSLGLRAEQSLTGNEIEVAQEIPGLGTPRAMVTADVADFSLLGRLGLDWQRGGLHVAVGASGRWNSDYDTVTGHLLVGYRF